MSGAIGPGDWVECVKDFVEPSPLPPVRGKIYCVTRVYPGPFPRCAFGIAVGGAVSTTRNGFDCNHFRPIYRPRQSIIEALKAPPKRAPNRQREDA